MIRSSSLRFRMGEREDAELRELAEYWQLKMSETVRHAVHNEVMRERHARKASA